MHKIVIVVVGFVIAGLILMGYREYGKIEDLTKTNQSLQQQITSLQQENKILNEQIKSQAVQQNDETAKVIATQFVKVFNNTSLTGTERSKQLQKLMTLEAFNKKIGSSLKEQPAVTHVQSRVEIKKITSTKIESTEKVMIDYDYIQSSKENYVERMNIVLDMVVSNGKWLVSNYEITYIEGPEGKGI